MGKVILFDLDGTLIPADTESFIKDYMLSLANYIKDYFPVEVFMKGLLTSTEAMVKNVDGRLTNQEVFMESFLMLTGFDEGKIMPVLEDFYEIEFPKLERHIKSTELSRAVVETALNQGRRVVIATNPLFPLVAVNERLRWVNLDDIEYALVTSYENSRFCKPQIEYYREILEKLDADPLETIMVGNDMQEDMVAAELGVRTYLVKDYLIDRERGQYRIDQHGSFEDLRHDINNKSGIFA
jgi:FMN phosphatase YigB (HAD superfamily)